MMIGRLSPLNSRLLQPRVDASITATDRMRQTRFFQGRAVWGILTALLVVCSAGVSADSAKEQKARETDDLFAGDDIPRLHIEIPDKGIERLRGRGWSWGWGGATRERPEVQATVREGD